MIFIFNYGRTAETKLRWRSGEKNLSFPKYIVICLGDVQIRLHVQKHHELIHNISLCVPRKLYL